LTAKHDEVSVTQNSYCLLLATTDKRQQLRN